MVARTGFEQLEGGTTEATKKLKLFDKNKKTRLLKSRANVCHLTGDKDYEIEP
jgi:hypothetical protein